MFRCDECDVNQDSCKSPARVVTHVRKVEYKHGEHMSYGQEVVKEKTLCANCKIKRDVAGTVAVIADGAPKLVERTASRKEKRDSAKERSAQRY